MMSKQSIDLPLQDGVLLRGYQKKLKTMKKKYFVLFGETASNCSRLEYFDNEKKFKSGSLPKRVIKLKNCFNINRRLDTKHEYVIALSTKDYGFGIVLESETEMIKWLDTLISLQRCDESSREKPRIHYEHVWQVVIQRKGLADDKGLFGSYHVCLAPQYLAFIKIDSQKYKERRTQNIEILLTTIRRCGDSHCFFYMEVGRQSIIGPGELWMETEDSLTAQNMHNMILSAMSTKSDNHVEPMRQRSLSANEASKPSSLLQKNRTNIENNTHISSLKLGFLKGRERCDSLPTSRNRNPSDCNTLSLTNLAILPCRNMLSHELQNPALNQHHSSSLPLTTTIFFSKGEKSSQGIDDQDENSFLLPYRFHTRSSQGVILEEKNEEMFNGDKSSDRISESLKNTSKNLLEPMPDDQNYFEDRKANSLSSETPYLPNQIRSICSDFSIRSSKLSNKSEENYTLMGPKCCDNIEPITNIKEIENFEIFPSVLLRNRGLRNNLFELTMDNFESISNQKEDTTSKSEVPTSTYSISNCHKQSKVQMACLSSSNNDASTTRERAFSVGSKTKIPRSDIQRGILNYRSSNKRYFNCSYNNSDLNEVTTNYQLINLSSYNDKKSTSAPLLNQKRENSFDRMSDLMEIDFSKSQTEITSLLGRPYNLYVKTASTNHDKLKSHKVFKSNSTIKIQNMNCSPASQLSSNNGYLEMKPVSSNLDLSPTKMKDDLSVYQFKLPAMQNESKILFCEINDEDIGKSQQSAKETNRFENNKNEDSMYDGLNDTSFITEYKNEIFESLTNHDNDFKLKNFDKTINNNNEVVLEYSVNNTKTETFKNFQLSCLKDHSFNEQHSKNIFNGKSTNTNNEDVHNVLTKQSEMPRNLSRIFFKYAIYGNESGYKKLHMKNESSLQPKIIYQLPKSSKLDLRSSPVDVIRTNSIKSDYLPFVMSSPKSSVSSIAISCERNKNSNPIYGPLSTEKSLQCLELKTVNNITPEQQSSDVLRPQLVSSGLELCYATLDLPQYQFETNYRSTKNNLTPKENIFGASLKTGSPSNFSYAKINFDHRDSN